MLVQGLGHKSLSAPLGRSVKTGDTAFTHGGTLQLVALQAEELPISRTDLLNSIRSKIKQGFYNSDAVIDDIGHGFAQALNSTM